MSPRAWREGTRLALPVFVALLVGLCFLPVLGNDFVNLDDPYYFTGNPRYRGLSPSHLRWMFTTLYMGHYQPLSWLTHGLVYIVWGVDPFGYHLGNLLLHAANAVLFYFLVGALLRRSFRPMPRDDVPVRVAAAAGALFFAIHPLRVEAVAWATERQEVLCSTFYLLTVLTYLKAQDTTAAPRTRRVWYISSIGCFALALLSKATAATLPAVLLALDLYPLRRFAGGNRNRARWTPIVTEKIPYVLLSCGAGALVLLAKQPKAMVPLSEYGVAARAMQAGYGVCFYLWKTLVPAGLSPLYLLNKAMNPFAPVYVLCAAVVIGTTATVIFVRQRWPWALTVWGCYIATLAPLLGLVQSGLQITADRYSYLACLPWAVLAAGGVHQLWRTGEAWQIGRTVWPSTLAALGIALLALGMAAHAQTRIWRDSTVLWSQALAVDPANYFAYASRGGARQERGDLDGALADYDAAIRLSPQFGNAYDNRGTALEAKGDLEAALADYTRALNVNPTLAIAYCHRGNLRRRRGDLDGALADYAQAIRFDPENAGAYNGRGRVHHARGNITQAIAAYDQAVRLDPQYANAYNNRGTARKASGDLDGAIADYMRAVQLAPSDGPYRATFERNLAAARRMQHGSTDSSPRAQ